MSEPPRGGAADGIDLDYWLPAPTLRVAHHGSSTAAPRERWQAACEVGLDDAALLGRLVRWRIPGLASGLSFDELFREDPFLVLTDSPERALISGMVGPIWTLRRNYPQLAHPQEFREWSTRGTARVLFANWVEATPAGASILHSETRVHGIGRQARLGLATLRPAIRAFGQLIATDGIEAAVRAAEQPGRATPAPPSLSGPR
jgi:hypothetical protein